jgi:hypothetical protein
VHFKHTGLPAFGFINKIFVRFSLYTFRRAFSLVALLALLALQVRPWLYPALTLEEGDAPAEVKSSVPACLQKDFGKGAKATGDATKEGDAAKEGEQTPQRLLEVPSVVEHIPTLRAAIESMNAALQYPAPGASGASGAPGAPGAPGREEVRGPAIDKGAAASSTVDGRVRRTWTLANTHPDFLQRLADERVVKPDDPEGVDPLSLLVEGLVREANSQTNQVKKLIFKIVRCHRCFQGGNPGGVKTELSMSLPKECMDWLTNVCERCKHSSIDKTMRILVEFHTHDAIKGK